jgi:hypothetical protein
MTGSRLLQESVWRGLLGDAVGVEFECLFEAEFPGQDVALVAGEVGWVRFAAAAFGFRNVS